MLEGHCKYFLSPCFSRRFSYTSCYLLYISSLYQRPTITFIYRSHRREVILNYRRHKFIVGNILQLLLSKTTLNISILLYIKKQKKKTNYLSSLLKHFLEISFGINIEERNQNGIKKELESRWAKIR